MIPTADPFSRDTTPTPIGASKMFDSRMRQTSFPWMSSAEASHVKTSAEPAREPGLPGNALDSGTNTGASSGSCVHELPLSKTSRRVKSGGCARCGPTCTLSVTERVPSRYLRPMSGSPIVESGSSLWPTPSVKGNHNRKGLSPTSGDGLSTAVASHWPTPRARDGRGGAGTSATTQGGPDLRSTQIGPLNPAWVETLMGCPIGWTDPPLDVASNSTAGSRRARPRTSDADPRD